MGLFDNVREKRETSTAIQNATSLPDNAFEISTQNPDGSKKYSFDTIYQDRNLINTARDYYENLYRIEYENDRDVVDEFISDRTWKQANIGSIVSEYYDVKKLDEKQRGNLAYLQNYWNNLPNFYEEGGRGWARGIFHNLWAGALDPTNLVSFGVGSVATKFAAKRVGATALRRQIAKTTDKEVKKKLRKELTLLEKQIKAGTYKAPIKKLTAAATIPTVGFDSSLFAAADLVAQNSEKQIGLRDKVDLKRTGAVAVIGGGISILPNGLFSYAAVKRGAQPFTRLSDRTIDDEVASTVNNISGTTKKDKPTGTIETAADKNTSILMAQGTTKKEKIANAFNKFSQKTFDNNNFYKIFVDTITGVKGMSTARGTVELVEQQKTAIKSGKKLTEEEARDPIAKNPYLLMKRLSSSLVRAKDFLQNGVMILKEVNFQGRKKLELVETANSKKDGGLEKIVEPFENSGELEQFLAYALAKKEKGIHQLNKGKKPKDQLKTVLTEKQADRLIDYGELTLKQYRSKYKVDSGRAPGINFKEGLKKLKGFTDDLLELQRQEGFFDAEQIALIKKRYPNGWVPAWGQREAEGVTFVAEKLLTNISTPGKKRAQKVGRIKQTVKINPLYLSLTQYTETVVKAVDKNRAKREFYKMYEDAVKRKLINKDVIVTKVSQNAPAYQKIVTKKAAEDLEKLGIKFQKDSKGNIKGLDKLADEDKTFSTIGFRDTFKDGDDVIDTVYIDGKKQFYKINSEMLKDTFEMIRQPSAFNKVIAFARGITRLPARAITYSPPFVAFNFIRDSLSATINSAFGFVPIFSSVQGFGLTFKGNKGGINMKKYTNAIRRNDEFRKAYVHGLGFTSRAETEWKANEYVTNIESYGASNATGFYKRNLNYLNASFFGKAARGYADFVGRIEYASRMAEYQYAKKFGLSSSAAAFLGREVSTDFAMRGSSSVLQQYSAVTMFFNAGLQGFYRGGRVLKENPKKALPAVGLTIVAPEISLWMLNHDYREYRDVPDEVKMLNYLIPMYVREAKDGSHLHEDGTRKIEEFIAIPKPYDFGIFANIATAMLEGVWTTSPGVATQYMGTALGVVMPGLAAPTLLNPWISMYTNLNWQGDPIKPTGFAKRDSALQYRTNTRESIIAFSKFIKKITGPEGLALRGDGKIGVTIPAVTLDYMVNSYLTGLASYPLDILDSTLFYDEKTFGELPTERGDREDLARQPWSIITRRFRVKTPVKNSKNIRKFYEIKNRADKVALTKSITTKELREVLNINDFANTKEVQELLGISPFLNMVAEKLAESRETRRKIKQQKYINLNTKEIYSADLKRKHIDELIAIENDLARVAINQLRQANFDTIESDIFGKTYDPSKYNKDTRTGRFERELFND